MSVMTTCTISPKMYFLDSSVKPECEDELVCVRGLPDGRCFTRRRALPRPQHRLLFLTSHYLYEPVCLQDIRPWEMRWARPQGSTRLLVLMAPAQGARVLYSHQVPVQWELIYWEFNLGS